MKRLVPVLLVLAVLLTGCADWEHDLRNSLSDNIAGVAEGFDRLDDFLHGGK